MSCITYTKPAMRRLQLTAMASIAAASIGAGMITDAHAGDAVPNRASHEAAQEGSDRVAVQTDLVLIAGLLLLTGAIVEMRIPDGDTDCHCDGKH